MTDGPRVTRQQPRWACPAAAAVIAAAALALPAGAFGGWTPRAPALSHSTNTSKALAYSRCMRAHGVGQFPDPTSGGSVPKVSPQELGVASSQLAAAERACQNLLPPGSNDQFPPGEVQQLLIGMLRFSRCMRSHGLPNWPDPTTDSQGRPLFPLSRAGFSRQQARSAQVMRVASECRHLMPSALGGIPIG